MDPANPARAFVDPEGYRQMVETRRKEFEALVAKEK
jgi:hypothetical protein